MDVRHFDYPSLMLYLALGIWGMICVRYFCVSRVNAQALAYSPHNGVSTQLRVNWRWGAGLVCVFAFWATFRGVAPYLGGIDALNYIDTFQNSLINTAADHARGNIQEPLFFYYCRGIRFFTDNYKFFFAVSYSLIPLSYLIFIKTYCPKSVSFIPFCLVVYPFLHSWCTLRSSLAIALFLIGLSIYKKNRMIGTACVLATFTVHRMSVIFVPIILFIRFFEKVTTKLSKWKLLCLISFLIVFSLFSGYKIQAYIISNGLLDGTDLYYLKLTQGSSWLARCVMFGPQAGLLCALVFLENIGIIKKTQEITEVKTLCYFDFILLPAAVICGFWRANQFLYIARLILWGILIKNVENSLETKFRLMYRIIVLSLFTAWLAYRIHSEYHSIGIMPYKFSWS